MIKKIIVAMAFLIFFINIGYGAVSIVNVCPGTNIQNDTEYVLSSAFNVNANPCFYLNNGTYHNITINGNFTNLEVSTQTNLVKAGQQSSGYDEINLDGLTIKNLNIYGNLTVFIYGGNPQDDDVRNIYILNNSVIESVSTSGTERGFLIFGGSSTPQGNTNADNLEIKEQFELQNNYYRGIYPFMVFNDANTNAIVRVYFDNFIAKNNDVLHYGGVNFATLGTFQGRGDTNTYDWYINGQFIFENNNVLGKKLFAREPTINASASNSFVNNFDGGQAQGSDLDSDGLTDSAITRTSLNSVVYSNVQEKTFSKSSSGLAQYEQEVYMSDGLINPNLYNDYGSSPHIIVSKPLTLTSSRYFNMGVVQGGILDLSLHLGGNNQPMIITQNTNVFRMGIGNTLYGGERLSDKAQLVTNSMPTVTYNYNSAFSTNWQIISYVSNFRVSNMNFDLNSVGNYGLIRKTSASTGDRFYFEDSEIDYNAIMTDTSTPTIMSGAFTNVYDSLFDIGQVDNQIIFRSGQSGSVSGGHLIIGNEFIGGGFVFQEFLASGTAYANSLIYNKFEKTSSTYSLPFNLTQNSFFQNLDLNGTYYYKTVCDSYAFNIGNYYRDLIDSVNGNCTDLDTDGFCDENPVFRGLLFNGDNITDYKALYTYPYNFAANTGGIIPQDLCGTFAFNIISPVEQNYTTTQVTTNWEYISPDYSDLICAEFINGESFIYENVDPEENNGVTCDMTSGYATHYIQCCDTPNCDNIVKESQKTDFCMGNSCATMASVINCSVATPISGCTDPAANNYNPAATIDDSSCTYGNGTTPGDIDIDIGDGFDLNLFTGSSEDSANSLRGLYGLAETPLGYLAIISIIMLVIAVLFLVLAIPIALIRWRS